VIEIATVAILVGGERLVVELRVDDLERIADHELPGPRQASQTRPAEVADVVAQRRDDRGIDAGEPKLISWISRSLVCLIGAIDPSVPAPVHV
jgi:hypothetical protein